ncbi:MAG: phosphate ABC transporter substrate-binding protein [Methylovulum sp.]|nr:phosphate ABC transporter substrate-binding protein [Methylovulum sp.]
MRLSRKIVVISVLCSASIFAKADVVVIVSASSSISQLDGDQVSDIYLGKTATFPDGSQAVPLELENGSELRDEFHEKVTGKSKSQLKSYWSKMVFSGKGNPPKDVADVKEVLKLIGANPNMIGYIDKGSVDKTVKTVFAP